LDPEIYREATARLDNHFTISIVDCGTTMNSTVMQAVLADLDAPHLDSPGRNPVRS
jgi:MinD-like ATPase involved in chromosome partitioning or flagellar assembly